VISRERYRQLVAKNRRLWNKLQEVEALLNDNLTKVLLDKKNAEIDQLRAKVLEFCEAVRNLKEPIFVSGDEYLDSEAIVEHDVE
jgi:hypothetical protein